MRTIIFLVLFSVAFGEKIQLGNEILECEIADTESSRSNGLMWREELAEGNGMLFIYPKEQILCFWMKNTFIPLSIGFFDKGKKLIKVADMAPMGGKTIPKNPSDAPNIYYHSDAPALYALEVPQGWFKKHKIQLGDKFTFLKPSDRVE